MLATLLQVHPRLLSNPGTPTPCAVQEPFQPSPSVAPQMTPLYPVQMNYIHEHHAMYQY
ncbi:unnamed protein product [Cylicostephanus goldi]|uniref:Uncharacterized protein n=1 Tax=Cylicostephanus goldi TaxID=71465 RepID=A0A3P6S0I3_CYLGO|nr:unnamed protein product [Cylicostephanus goldi]